MSNIIRSTTDLALHIAREYIKAEGVIVDATCGNGHDTLALAKAAPKNSRIFAFDIQQDAIDATRTLLQAEGFAQQLENCSIRLICDSHENMTQYLTADNNPDQPLKANLIIFNLGYMPGGDKTITTKAHSSLEAIKTSLALLARDGAVCITMYSGHPEGAKEKAQLLDFARNLDSREFHVAYINMVNQPNNPPEILIITTKR